ncbi:hypothetical protein MNEG_7867 [Monoraphidium neglectum]|uniref:Uncharacterized protein n=1 Tax=Monoraphidium neglectum TaxID=145388 RepID=A0A0D2KXW9_9CHLO|nr:hypothetical protein MNEG_7867 [Monoraphidium neglectum]KIZ00094.1 hypothetical protein MNEG_7867 [Monoraphidium neglectum]|eukprot:XP_013899113.1 hypothetical protein MNEG_7867 [Monoraphidium neglectum]
MSRALQVAHTWGQAFGDLDPAPVDELALLLQTRDAPEDAGDLLQWMLPLFACLESPDGKARAEELVPRLAEALGRLPSVWSAPHESYLRVQADAAQLMASAQRLICLPTGLPPVPREQLSRALRGAVGALLAQALSQQEALRRGESGAAWARSGCNLLLRALTREGPFASGAPLPLLPEDAAALLQALRPAAAAADGGGPLANGGGPAVANGGSGPAASVRLPELLTDDKIYILISNLAATAAAVPALAGGAALVRLLVWSSRAVKQALRLLAPPSGHEGAPAPPLEATCGAADLANVCAALLLGASGGGGGAGVVTGEVPVEVLRQVEDLIDLALSLAETAVAAAAQAPADPSSARALCLAARVLAGGAALVAAPASGGSRSADISADVISRLHDLLLETARLTAAPDAPSAGVGNGHAAAGPGPGAPVGELPGGVAAELASPLSWDVTRPLTRLSDGTQLRHLPLAAGMGAQRLLRAAAEALVEALAAAWGAGARSGVNILLLPRPSSAAGWHEQMVGLGEAWEYEFIQLRGRRMATWTQLGRQGGID